MLLTFWLAGLSAKGQSAEPAGESHTRSLNAHLLQAPDTVYGLSGNGVTIHQWEAPAGSNPFQAFADSSINELQGRLTPVTDSLVGSSHATEMALIMAGNSADSTKAGLAPQALIRNYRLGVFNDSAFTLAAGNMRLALHAYAENFGWNGNFWFGLEEIDSTEDYNWGRYTRDTRFWDSLAFAHPHYLALRSAGNSRGDSNSGTHQIFRSVNNSTTNYTQVSSNTTREADGGTNGLDCLPPISTAKNALIVGAVNLLPKGWQDSSSVVARPGSAYGPTDDGRIKPDVVAGGEKTSQSAAALTGALALLSEQFKKNRGCWPLSSTLRALVINTSQEAGERPGPDFRFGYGLPDIKAAAEAVQEQRYNEDTLGNGDTARYYFYATANEVKLTLAWTDREGTPVTFANDPAILDNNQPMLVNDLDMRLQVLDSSRAALPWRLSLSNPVAAATQGNNTVDNVEKIETTVHTGQWLVLTVTHKGNLQGGTQALSLTYQGAAPAMIYENGRWKGAAPTAATGRYHALIRENSQVTIPGGFHLESLIIKRGAQVQVQ